MTTPKTLSALLAGETFTVTAGDDRKTVNAAAAEHAVKAGIIPRAAAEPSSEAADQLLGAELTADELKLLADPELAKRFRAKLDELTADAPGRAVDALAERLARKGSK